MAIQQNSTTRDRIEKAIKEFAPMVTLDRSTTFDDVKSIIRFFMRMHPEIFWYSHQYRYDEKSGILRFKYNFTREKADFYKGEIEKVVKVDFQIDCVRTLSELERLVYVYKWIANRTTYNEYSSFNQTIYSVLVNRNSVCTGYAKTAQYLLALVGIESELVFGKFHSDKSEHGRHVWNIVKINGKWYHVDFCLADKELSYLLNENEVPIEKNSIFWNYFGVPAEKILKNRSIEFVETLPECNEALSDYPNVELLRPLTQLICCKSDSGTSSRVYLNSFNKNTVIKISRNGLSDLLQNEAKALAELSDCPHIIKSYGWSDSGLELEQLTPWSELLNSHYYDPAESNLRSILHQLIEGLIECRNKGITYSDIHYNNVFITKDGTYKWGDFGIAFPNQSDGYLPTEVIGNAGKPKGSYWLMAPETYHRKIFTESSAIYSVAMMAYFVMNDMRPPFWTDEEHNNDFLTQRLSGSEISQPIFVDRYRDLWQIILKALSYAPDTRPRSYEDFLSILDNDKIECLVGVTPRMHSKYVFDENVVMSNGDLDCDQSACPISNDSYGEVDVSTEACIDDSFANTLVIESDNIIGIDDTDLFPPAPKSRWADGGIYDSDSFACTCKDSQEHSKGRETFGITENIPTDKCSFWNRMFGKKAKSDAINASAYAPAEIMPYRHFIVRIFLYRPEESSSIDLLVKDVDKTAVKKANKPLDVSVKEGDRITVQLYMTDGISIDESIQNVTWKSRYIECDFGCKLLKKNLYSVLGRAIIAVNNVPCGDLKFTIDVVPTEAQNVYAPVETKRYSKIFISYAHADYSQVRGIAEGCKMNGSDYFFDRHTLRAGDIFKDKILEYIDNADLFVLCWSKNAAESEWVQIERKHALELIERGNHQLAIYPLSIPPEAPLPEDMSDKYNFATL